MTAPNANSGAIKCLLGIIAAITALAGVVTILAFIWACVNVFLHIWVHAQASDIAIELLITSAGVAFGAYIVFLGYRLAFHPSRSTFERVLSLMFISVFVVFQHGRPLSSGYLLSWFCVALFGYILLRKITSRLFAKDG